MACFPSQEVPLIIDWRYAPQAIYSLSMYRGEAALSIWGHWIVMAFWLALATSLLALIMLLGCLWSYRLFTLTLTTRGKTIYVTVGLLAYIIMTFLFMRM
jgi:hypothetical protein